jgi:hypothetical protein
MKVILNYSPQYALSIGYNGKCEEVSKCEIPLLAY